MVTQVLRSRETCTEAGWDAYDCMLSGPLEEETILSLRPLGGFLYLKALKVPFFKVEDGSSVIRGVLGGDCVRVAAHRGRIEERLREVLEVLGEGPPH